MGGKWEKKAEQQGEAAGCSPGKWRARAEDVPRVSDICREISGAAEEPLWGHLGTVMPCTPSQSCKSITSAGSTQIHHPWPPWCYNHVSLHR